MPHLVILDTPNLDAQTDMTRPCRTLADTMLKVEDEADQPISPTSGVRVLACLAARCAVTDGSGDHAFVYLNPRRGRGRSDAVRQHTREMLSAAAQDHFAPLLAQRPAGLTLQVDGSPEVFDTKFGNPHPLFQKAR